MIGRKAGDIGLALGLLIALMVVERARAAAPLEKTLSPYFLVETDGTDKNAAERFPLKGTNVDVSIRGVIADVVVSQSYQNGGDVPIHAKYVFPASSRAAVNGMTMTIGDQRITAKIKERETAQKEYDAAKAEGKSASLLKQHRPNVFSMNVSNIMPGDVVDVELRYTELLIPTDGVYEFVYPTVVGPRYSSQPESQASENDMWVKNPYLTEKIPPRERFNLSVDVSTGIPINELRCSTHQVEIDWKSESRAEVSLLEVGESGANRDYILRYALRGDEIRSGLLVHQGDEENFFLMMAQPPERVRPEAIPPREYVFVVDVSGSMGGFPLNVAKKLLRNLIGGLRETDAFNVILFAGGARRMSPAPVTATRANIDRAITLIDEQRGGGGTELLAALEQAVATPRGEGAARSIVVVTDGYVTVEKAVFKLIAEHRGDANVFAFGIGSSVNRYLVEGIAKAGMGEPFVVTEPGEADQTAERFRKYVESPVLTDVSVDFVGVEAYDLTPETPCDLFAERPIVMAGKWRGSPDGSVVIKGKAGDVVYRNKIPFNLESNPADNKALRQLWARSRIADLSDYGFDGDDPDVKGEITSLGLTYQLLTRHTSFIAVLEKVRNPSMEGEDVAQPLPLPKGVSNSAIGVKLPEPDLWLIVVVSLVFLGGWRFVFSAKRKGAVE